MDATNNFNMLLAMAISKNNEESSPTSLPNRKTCLISGEPLQDNILNLIVPIL